MRECQAGPGHLARVGWREALRAGPAGWKDILTWRTLRVAAGVVLPLAAGAASGHAQYGAFASLGALPAGLASFQGVTRTRVAAVAVASAGMAVSTFVGGTVAAAAPWLLVPVVMVWGYVTGLAVCLGPLASVAVAQWPVALLIAVGLPLGPGDAALRAGLVLAGGLFQGILAMIAWTVRRGDPERAALAASYRSLAAYAAGLAAGRTGPPPGSPTRTRCCLGPSGSPTGACWNTPSGCASHWPRWAPTPPVIRPPPGSRPMPDRHWRSPGAR